MKLLKLRSKCGYLKKLDVTYKTIVFFYFIINLKKKKTNYYNPFFLNKEHIYVYNIIL